MTEHAEIQAMAGRLVDALSAAGKSVATAESCTGGWVAKAITDVAGSSQCFSYGIVSYSNGAKESLLGVSHQTLLDNGAVSEATVIEMAEGALKLSGADFSVAVSGIAGPEGGSDEKPVGTIWFAWSVRNDADIDTSTESGLISGDRDEVRSQTVVKALRGIQERLKK